MLNEIHWWIPLGKKLNQANTKSSVEYRLTLSIDLSIVAYSPQTENLARTLSHECSLPQAVSNIMPPAPSRAQIPGLSQAHQPFLS